MRFCILLLFLLTQSMVYGKTQFEAKLYAFRAKESRINNLKWVSRLLPVSRELNGKWQGYVVLKGKFSKDGWILRSSKVKVKRTRTGAMLALVPIKGERTDISFTAYGPNKVKERGAFVIHFPDYQKFRKHELQKQFKKKKIVALREKELQEKKKKLEEHKKSLDNKKTDIDKEESDELAALKEEVSEEQEDEEDFQIDEKEEVESKSSISSEKRHYFNLGVSVGTLNLSDIFATDYSSLVGDIRGAYKFQFTSNWNFEFSGRATGLRISADGGIPNALNSDEANAMSLLNLGFSLGRSLTSIGGLDLSGHIGYDSIKMSVDNQAYGAESLAGMNILLKGNYELLMKKKFVFFFKYNFNLSATAIDGSSVSGAMSIFGGSYHFSPSHSGSHWSLDADFSSAKLTSDTAEFSISSMSIGPTYHF